MATTLYSHSLRILACQGCGAPLEAAVQGGSFGCTYCGAVNRLAARDERRDLERAREALSISESERYSRLREQEYAGELLPAAIDGMVTADGSLAPESIEEAKREWLSARAELEAAPSFPIQERFFHLTVLLAPHFAERARRAVLETAAETLTDDRHRHVLRCLLATHAAREGDTLAAEEWLSTCNPRSVDLTMDSSHRLASATLSSARGDYAQTLAILGVRDDDVPITARAHLPCALLRIDALERSGRIEEATEKLRELLDEYGEDTLRAAILEQRPLRVCDETWFRIARAQARRRITGIEMEIGALEAHRFDSRKLLRSAFIFIVTTVTVWGFTSDIIQVDPLFGAHAAIVCPRICKGCHGPYRHDGWTETTRRGGEVTIGFVRFRLCRDPQGRIAALTDHDLNMALRRGEAWLQPYRVGSWLVYGLLFVALAPFVVVAVAWRQYHHHVNETHRRRTSLAERLARARAALAEIEARRPSGR